MEVQQLGVTPKISRKVRADAQLAYHDAMLNTEQLSALLQVDRSWVRRLSHEGVLHKVDGRFRLIDAVQAYLRHVKDEQRRTGKAAMTNRVLEARAKDIELRTRLREKSLIEIDDAVGALDDIMGVMLTELSEMPARTRDLNVRRIIAQAVYDARQKIADRCRAKIAELTA
jgi:hypothetical protein